MKKKPMTVPADLRRLIEDQASAMMVPPAWALRGVILAALNRMSKDDDFTNDVILAVEGVRDASVIRMPRVTPLRAEKK